MANVLTAKTKDERAELYQKAEVQLDKDSAIVPLYYYVNARLVKPYVGGYTGKDPLDNVYDKTCTSSSIDTVEPAAQAAGPC